VPFYLRTGKCLPARCSEVAIQFRQAPVSMFRDTAVERTAPNLLVLHIQPDEGISLTFGAKMPGPTVRMAGVEMDFRYRNYFEAPRAVGYETLLYDCMSGDATLFQRADNVEAGWRVVDPILDHWASETPVDFPNYAAGSAGPKAADQLLQRDGKRWRPIA